MLLLKQDHFDHTTQNLPVETLQEMELPEVPEDLKDILSIKWKSKFGVAAPSAIAAVADKKGQPLVVFSLKYRSYLHEEEHPFKHIMNEFDIFSSAARELK
jgi:hypothetical protein